MILKLVGLASVATLVGDCTTFGPIKASGSTVGEKLGSACNRWVLAPIAPFTSGRNDIRFAASQGNIRKVGIVDYETRWYGAYGETCTNVYIG